MASLPSDAPPFIVVSADPKTALNGQIERIQWRKHQLEKRSPRIPKRKMEQLELFLIELQKQLDDNNLEAAPLIYIKCLALMEDLERLYPPPPPPPDETIRSPIAEWSSSNAILVPPLPLGSASLTVFEPAKLVDPPGTSMPTAIRQQQQQQNRFLHFAGKTTEHNVVSRGGAGTDVNRRSLWNRITDRGMRKLRDRTSGARADEVRDLWNTQIEFFLSCLGFIVGGGNTLRFPAMIFEFGGIFFIPHLFFMVIFGFPLVYMHLAIGQYSGLSASAAFYKMMPIASGLGWALVLLALPVSIYYIFYVVWGFYYLWFALHGIFEQDGMAWEHCRPEWVQHFNCCELSSSSNVNGGELCGDYGAQSMPAPEAFF